MGDDEWAEDIGAWRDSNLAQIRERLADGLDPGRCLPWLRSTPLHQAAQEGAVQVIELLLASGAAVDAVDGDGATPLWEAVRHGQDDAVRALSPRAPTPGGRASPDAPPASRHCSPSSRSCSPTFPGLPASALG